MWPYQQHAASIRDLSPTTKYAPAYASSWALVWSQRNATPPQRGVGEACNLRWPSGRLTALNSQASFPANGVSTKAAPAVMATIYNMFRPNKGCLDTALGVPQFTGKTRFCGRIRDKTRLDQGGTSRGAAKEIAVVVFHFIGKLVAKV